MSEELRNITRRAVEKQRMRFARKTLEPEKLVKDPVYAVARYVMAAAQRRHGGTLQSDRPQSAMGA